MRLVLVRKKQELIILQFSYTPQYQDAGWVSALVSENQRFELVVSSVPSLLCIVDSGPGWRQSHLVVKLLSGVG